MIQIHFDDNVDEIGKGMQKVKTFKDIDKAKRDYSLSNASDAVFDELKKNVMTVVKEYMKINKNKMRSKIGLKKMEGKI